MIDNITTVNRRKNAVPSRKVLILSILMVFCSIPAYSQTETGLPFLKNYYPADYRAHAQNFDVVQDNRGVMYIGNFAGVLEFDGVSWNLITTGKITRISSLAISKTGVVYVGAYGEIGCLSPDQNGTLGFVSLNDKIDTLYRDFREVKKVLSKETEVLFITEQYVFRYYEDEIKAIHLQEGITSAYQVDGKIYLQLWERGLVELKDDEIIIVPGGDYFKGAFEIKEILKYQNKLLIATSSSGLYVSDSQKIEPVNSRGINQLKTNQVTSSVVLSDGRIAFGTMRNGIIIMNEQWQVDQTINRVAGIQNQYIRKLFVDKSKNLWAALNNGVSLINIPSPLSFFDEKSDLDGSVTDIIRLNGRLLISTFQGVFYYSDASCSFQSIPEITVACWHMVPYRNSVLAATSKGVFMITGNHARQISDRFTFFILKATNEPSLFYCGESDGMYRVIFEGFEVKSCGKIEGSDGDIDLIAEDIHGNIWYSGISTGVYRFDPQTANITYYGIDKGIPSEQGNRINKVDNMILVTTRDGVFKYDVDKDAFISWDVIKGESEDQSIWAGMIVQGPEKDLWITDGDETSIKQWKYQDGNYNPIQTPFLPMSQFTVHSIFFDSDNVVLFGGPEGIIRYNPDVPRDYTYIPPVLIGSVNTKNDSVLFGGYPYMIENNNTVLKDFGKILKHRYNSLDFNFSLPYFNAIEQQLFQYYLEGFDEFWSDWTSINFKEYTNLSKGDYIFHVRAKNIYDGISQESTYSFSVLAPWYSTTWAYFLYAFIFVADIILISRWRSRRLMKEKQLLEKKIDERTAEVVEQKNEVEKKSAEVAAKNEELEKINIVVKSINSEIQIAKLMQSLLEKTRMIKAAERSTVLVLDKKDNLYKYRASIGWDLTDLSKVSLTLEQAMTRYTGNASEVYEDIFLENDFNREEDIPDLDKLESPKAILVMMIKVDDKVEGFLILENMSKSEAFGEKELSFVKNLKEHIVSAFIKSKILEDLQSTLDNLKETQQQLVQSEKLASLGQLTAGIAHEIQNPLNFVNNFSTLSIEMADELKEVVEEVEDKIDEDTYDDILDLVETIEGNVTKINEHGKRAESIVKGMLQHSRGKSGEFQEMDINGLIKEYVGLAYHGMRAKDKSFNTNIISDYDPAVGKLSIVPQDFSRAILNIVNNACYAVDEKQKKLGEDYKPEIIVNTKMKKGYIEIRIKDNGTGIPKEIIDKIFNPFFTTKPTGKGTGLGLSMTHDIISQIHNGKLEVKSSPGESTEFVIQVPVKR